MHLMVLLTKVKINLYLLAILCFMLISCDCRNVDCQGDVFYFEFELVKDDVNVLLDSGIRQSICLRRDGMNECETISFISDDYQLHCGLHSGFDYLLDIPSIDTLTLEVTSELMDNEGCCALYEFISLSIDNIVYCESQCLQISVEL